VKGSSFLDTLASVKTVIFDKTGTLTRGVFQVTEVKPAEGFTQNELLAYAAQAEVGSNHPIAQSIREAYDGEPVETVDETWEVAGHGVQTVIGGQVILAGNDSLLHKNGVIHDLDLCDIAGTVVHVAVDGRYAGCIMISDELKSDAIKAAYQLRSNGVDRLVMLTGDNRETANEIAVKLGLDDFQADLLPEGKTIAVEEILTQERYQGKVAFVGDGINDAPALTRADVGIAMGALGSEAAIESADVVIMTESPLKVAEAIRISRKTRSIVWQNITLALLVKAVFIAMGVAGTATMWQAVFGDMGVALLAVFNASRALVKDRRV
jgi:Cd2+/Zn2+-exporting ATPase